MMLLAPSLVYLCLKAIQRYCREKNLLESGIHIIDTMSGVEFEELLLAHYKNLGYSGRMTDTTSDYGADLVLEKDNRKIVVQAKRWKSVVGIEAVQQVIGAIRYYGALKGIVITNSVFTENACQLAKANDIELVDRQKLIEMMKKSQGNKVLTMYTPQASLQSNERLDILPDEQCPLCKNTLVRRKGKYGEFIGCSHFPSCRFTKKI